MIAFVLMLKKAFLFGMLVFFTSCGGDPVTNNTNNQTQNTPAQERQEENRAWGGLGTRRRRMAEEYDGEDSY